MYGNAALYFFVWPLFLIALAVLSQMVLGQTFGAVVYLLLAFGVRFVVLPMFANALYHRHVKARIADVLAKAPSHEAAVQRLIGQSSTSSGVAVAVFACIFGTGILTIIAIQYGADANRLISGHVLILTPQALPDGAVDWLCGYAEPETVTDIPPKYLPTACRLPT